MPNTAGSPDTAHLAAKVAAGRWILDPARSSVAFASKTFWGLMTVNGEFGSVSGEGEVLPDGGAHGTLTVQAASLDTKHAKRDTHLRSADFFSAEEHPEVVFTAHTVTPAADDTVEVAGDLSIRGTSRPLTLTARVTEAGEDAVTLQTEAAISRIDFGMTWNQLGMLKDPATLSVTARFQRQS